MRFTDQSLKSLHSVINAKKKESYRDKKRADMEDQDDFFIKIMNMEDMDKKKMKKPYLKDIIFFMIVILCVVLILYLIFFIKSEDALCLKNPFVYGAYKMGNVSCSCMQLKNPQCPPTFYFDDHSFNTTKGCEFTIYQDK